MGAFSLETVWLGVARPHRKACFMIPAKYSHILFSLLLSGMMSFLVSGLSTFRAVGFEGLGALWMSNWLASWAIAFPAVLVVAPIARALVARLVRPD